MDIFDMISEPAAMTVGANETITAAIDAGIAATDAEQPRRAYVGASAIGQDCLRGVQLAFMGVAADEGAIQPRTRRIFRLGHRIEDILVEWFREGGFEMDTLDPDTHYQWGWKLADGRGRGHLDAIIRSGPAIEGLRYPALWEAKGLNAANWNKVVKEGLVKAKPVYAAQVAINQWAMALNNPALVTVMNKDTGDLYHELIPLDVGRARRGYSNMMTVIEATDRGAVLPRPYKDPTDFRCRFCDRKAACWGMDR